MPPSSTTMLLLSLSLRLGLVATGTLVLVSVVRLTMNGFDILSDGFFLTMEDYSDGGGDDDKRWMAFLGGEFTFSCLIPLGYHLVQASLQGGRSLSTYLVLSILAGVTLGQCLGGGAAAVTSNHKKKGLWNYYLFVGVLFYASIDKRGRPGITSSTPSTTMTKKNVRFHSMVRFLVKLGSIGGIVTGIMVLGMGVTQSSNPSKMLPALVWTGFGYEYNLVQTFGRTTAESPPFFGILLCTMLGTICQTLCLALWTALAPVGSPACRQGLALSCTGVPLILLANACTAAIYQARTTTKDDDAFFSQQQGRDCMIAHILLLVQTNAHLPIIWWVHELWVEMVLFAGSTATTSSCSDGGEDPPKFKLG